MRLPSLLIVIVFSLLLSLIVLCLAHAQIIQPADIDMHKIMMIESSGNPMAHNKRDDSRGLYQITPICLKEWNNFHPNNIYTMNDLWNPLVNREIAEWYLTNRIPQMIRYYKKPMTTENIIIAYNAGISYVVHGGELPSVTKQYLKKYFGGGYVSIR